MIHGDMTTHKYEVEGIKPQIMTELATLMHSLYEHGMFDRDDFNHMVELACMSEEELAKTAAKSVGELADKNVNDEPFKSMLSQIFDDAIAGKPEAMDIVDLLAKLMFSGLEK